MGRYNSGSIIFIALMLFIIFIFFQFLGIIFLIIRGIGFIVFRYWYIILGIVIVMYFKNRKKSEKGKKHYKVKDNKDGKTIEIHDYEVK